MVSRLSRDQLSDITLDRLAGDLNDADLDQDISPPEESLAILRSETQRLSDRYEDMMRYRNYYEGDQSLVFGSAEFIAKFGDQFQNFSDNWTKVVVNSRLNRLRVEGVNIFDAATSAAEAAQEDIDTSEIQLDLWRCLSLNNFDSLQDDAHTGILVEGRGGVVVWPDSTLGGARIDWNPGQNIITRRDDEGRRTVWAVKRWQTPSGIVRVNLYLPDRVEKYIETSPMTMDPSANLSPAMEVIPQFTGSHGYRLVSTVPNPLGFVPVVEFNARDGSILKDVIAQQDALNYLVVSMLVATGNASWPQKVMMGNFSEPDGGWQNDPGRVWKLVYTYDADGNPIPPAIGEFKAPDPTNMVNAIQEALRHVASTSSTPMRFFYQSDRGGRGDSPSGESLRVDDEPLIDSIEAFQRRVGNQWYELFSMMARAALFVDRRQQFPPGEPFWRDPQARHRTILLQDGALMQQLGIPFEFIVNRLGFGPLEVEEMLGMKAMEDAKKLEEAERLAEQSALNSPSSNGASSTSSSTSSDTSGSTQTPRLPTSPSSVS